MLGRPWSSLDVRDQPTDVVVPELQVVNRAEEGGDQSPVGHVADVGRQVTTAACSVEQTRPLVRVFGEAKNLGDLPKLLRVGRGMASPVLDVTQIRRLDVDQLSEPAQADSLSASGLSRTAQTLPLCHLFAQPDLVLSELITF